MRRAGLAIALLLSGCFGRPPSADYAAMIGGKPSAYLSGTILSATVLDTLHKRDFVYAIDTDPLGTKVAFTHLAPKVYRLDIFGGSDLVNAGDPPPNIGDPEICSNEFDPEGLAWSPDGQRIAVASRDRAVRIFDAKGNLLLTTYAEEPLASLAWSPNGKYLAAGSEHGLIALFHTEDLSFGFDVRGHNDSVRGLAFSDDGTLWSGGWDKQVRSFTIAPEPRPITEVRLHADTKAGLTAVHGLVNGKAPALFTLDERNDLVTLSPEAALKAGIDASFLKDHVQQPTPGGLVELPIAKDQTLLFKNFLVPHVDVAICGQCQVAGVDGVLGKHFADRFQVSLDETTHEVIFRAKEGEKVPTLNVPVLQPAAHFLLDGFVNDVTVSRDGTRLGVAMNEIKAERNLALYKREKAGDEEPILPGNIAAIVDAKSGKVLEKHNQHKGIVATAAISPDGRSIASGGWDKKMFVFSGSDVAVSVAKYGWSVRKVRFSRDGRLLAVGAWTPQNARNADSDPAAQLFRITYADPKVIESR